MKILVAEDDPVSVKIMQVTLEHYGHEVVVTNSGEAAWAAFDREPVRVILSDWMMPGMNGLELCRQVRERKGCDYTYFILLTAINTSRDNLREAMDSGVDDFLKKPLDREAVMMRLRVAERIIEYTTQIRQLKEMLPICMYCKRIRDDQDYWQQVESYIHTHTGSNFSHGICPDCFSKQMRGIGARSGMTVTPG